MKKFLAGIAAAAIITVPMTSFALESMSKGALKKATGQAGVSIAIDNVVILQKSMPTTTYWDIDGTSSYDGTVGVANAGLQISYMDTSAQKLIVLDGILAPGTSYGTAAIDSTFGITGSAGLTGITQVGFATPAGAGNNNLDPTNGDMRNATAGVYVTGASPLTIDVGTCESLTLGLNYNLSGNTSRSYEVAGVVIGLPTLQITTYHSADVKVISIATDASNAGGDDVTDSVANSGSTVVTDDDAATFGQVGTSSASLHDNYVSNELIRIEKAGVSQMAILGGRIEIAPH